MCYFFVFVVCDLGPLLVSTNTLNQKNLYKMLTKTTEFYITYAMGGHSIIQVKYLIELMFSIKNLFDKKISELARYRKLYKDTMGRLICFVRTNW